MLAPMGAKAAALALLFLASVARGQQDPGWQIPGTPAAPTSSTPTTLHFTKQPNEALPVPGANQPTAPAIGRPRWENRPVAPAVQAQPRYEAPPRQVVQETTPQPQKYPVPPLPKLYADESTEMIIPLEPPGPQRLFRLDSEADMKERMRQEGRERQNPERIVFPEEPVVSQAPYTGRSFPNMVASAEPNYVLYRRLFFEERNAERFGWDLGIMSPVVAAGAFYWDLALLPYQIGELPFRRFDSNAGLCLPGDAVPYRLYPPVMSLSGTALEAGVIVALFAIFP